MKENELSIQGTINSLIKLRKDYMGAGGCSMTHMDINQEKLKVLRNAIELLNKLLVLQK